MSSSNQLSLNIKDHGVTIDPASRRVKCNYCNKEVTSFSRLKYHLSGIRGDVTPCLLVPTNVKEVFHNELCLKKPLNVSPTTCNTRPKRDHREDKTTAEETVPTPDIRVNSLSRSRHGFKRPRLSLGFKRTRMDSREDNNTVGESIPMPSSGTNSSSEMAKKQIAQLLYETATDFKAITSPSFAAMINDDKAIPSCEELRGWILDDAVHDMQNYVQEMKRWWTITGCSIILDNWKDEKGRELVNVLVNCPKGAVYLSSFDMSAFGGDTHAMDELPGEVFAEVGIENIVQIITNSESAYMNEVKKMVTNKYWHIYWKISATTCLQQMLEKFENMSFIKVTLDETRVITGFIQNNLTNSLLRSYTKVDSLIMHSKVQSVAPYLTLENIALQENGLKNTFSSPKWKASDLSNTIEGKKIARLVKDPSFWNRVLVVLNATIPIVRVLCLINEDNKPQTGLIYETIDQAKETIRDGMEELGYDYMPLWNEVDEIWNGYLHSSLHCAAYVFSPSLLYVDDFFDDLEICLGFYTALLTMVRDSNHLELILSQFEDYYQPKWDDEFSRGCHRQIRSTLSPAQWWEEYGKGRPELQQLAIRVVSQTCDGGLKFGLKRSLVETLLTKGMNRIEQQMMSKLIFVNYNLQLKYFA